MVRYLVRNIFLNPMIFFSLGLGLIVLGAVFIIESPRLIDASAQVSQLKPLSPALLGAEVFIEGFISKQNPVVRQQFVTYILEEYRSATARSSRWIEVARYTPPLTIEVQERVVQIVNSDYRLESSAVTVQEKEPTFFKGAVQSRGLITRTPVFVVGTVVAAGQLDAKFIYAGTRDTYLTWQENQASVDRKWGPRFVAVGLGLTLLAIWLLYKWLREDKNESSRRKRLDSRTPPSGPPERI